MVSLDEEKVIYGRQADIWAAGLTLYSIATGQDHLGDVKGHLDLRDKIINFKIDESLL
jgi:hypothetical protein